IVSSDAFADEKIRTMRAFGAEVELVHSPEGITPDLIPTMMRRAAEIAEETGGYATDQFNNTDMVRGYLGLGSELLAQLPGAPPITTSSRTPAPPDASSAPPRRCGRRCPTCTGSRSSRGSRLCSPAGRPARTTLRAAASVVDRRSCS